MGDGKSTGKARVKDQTPTLCVVFRKANTIFRVAIAIKNAFLDPVDSELLTHTSYIQACDELGDHFSAWKSKNLDVVKSLVSFLSMLHIAFLR